MLTCRAFLMWLAPGMGDAKAVAGALLVPTQVAAQAAAETFKKSRRDRSFFIPTSPFLPQVSFRAQRGISL
jgi:hypothetical protein